MLRSLIAVAVVFVTLSAHAFEHDFDSIPTSKASALDRRLTQLEEAMILQHDAAREREAVLDDISARLKSIEVSILASAKAPLKAPDLKKAAKVERQGYPVRGGWWSGCPNWTHLTRGEHAGKYDPDWLKGLSNAEIQSLHADDHERRVKSQYVVRPGTTAVQVVSIPVATKSKTVTVTKSSSGGCPGSNCPSSRSGFFGRQW